MAILKRASLLLLLSTLAAATSLVVGAELRRTHRIGAANRDHEGAWSRHVDHVSWLDDERIVYWINTGTLYCRDLRTNTQLWAVAGLHKVSDWSVAPKSRRLAVLYSSEPDAFSGDLIRVLDGKTGRTIYSTDSDRLAELLKVSHVLPTRIALTPDDARLVICGFSTYFGRNAFVLDPTYSKVVATFDVDAMPSELTVSTRRVRATVLADEGVLCTRDMKTNQEIHFDGERILKEPESLTGMIDVPFLSHARHDGKNTLVSTVDNSWATGRVSVYDLQTKKAETFNARNGHIEIDVDFAGRRLVLTGTEQDVTLMSFDGTVIAEFPNATLQRNTCVEFSPSGKQIAVGSWDTTVTIFAVEE